MGGVHHGVSRRHNASGALRRLATKQRASASTGANRLGLELAAELLVFGEQRAAPPRLIATTVPRLACGGGQARTEWQRLEHALTRHARGGERIAHMRTDMKGHVETAAGSPATTELAKAGPEQIGCCRKRFAKVGPTITAHNVQLRTLTPMFEVAGDA